MTKSRKAKKVQYIAYSDESDDSCAEPLDTQPVEVKEPDEVNEPDEVEAPVKKTRKPRKSRKKKVVEEDEAKQAKQAKQEDLTASMSSVKLDDKPVKAKKPKRKPSKYNEYIALMMKDEAIKKLPPKLRFAQISKFWREEKAKLAK